MRKDFWNDANNKNENIRGTLLGHDAKQIGYAAFTLTILEDFGAFSGMTFFFASPRNRFSTGKKVTIPLPFSPVDFGVCKRCFLLARTFPGPARDLTRSWPGTGRFEKGKRLKKVYGNFFPRGQVKSVL